MLHDDGNIGFDYAGVIGVVRYRFRIGKFIETNVFGARRFNDNVVRSGRFPIGKENGDINVGVLIAAIENTHRVVTHQLPTITCAGGRNVTIGDYPALTSRGLVHVYHSPVKTISLETAPPPVLGMRPDQID